jgi:hypothetical protein
MDNDLRRRIHDTHYEAATRYTREANEVFRELSRHLILIATFVIAVSPAIFSIGKTISDASCYEKNILVLSLFLLFLSIVFGIIQFIVDYMFFRKSTKIEEEIMECIRNESKNLEDIKSFECSKFKESPSESGYWPIIIQGIFLVVGLFLFFVFLIGFLL